MSTCLFFKWVSVNGLCYSAFSTWGNACFYTECSLQLNLFCLWPFRALGPGRDSASPSEVEHYCMAQGISSCPEPIRDCARPCLPHDGQPGRCRAGRPRQGDTKTTHSNRKEQIWLHIGSVSFSLAFVFYCFWDKNVANKPEIYKIAHSQGSDF